MSGRYVAIGNMADGKAKWQNMGHVWDVPHAVPSAANLSDTKKVDTGPPHAYLGLWWFK